jgi:2-polyprenyl-6-methoxyphenol hydroxylase-like FAD-dependent oxidoreductase
VGRPSPDADVVVVGAGPVGAALAMALGLRGRRVILVEKAASPQDKPCGEGMMPLGARLLQDLGLDLGALGYPAVDGVRYQVAGGRGVAGAFRVRGAPAPGYGVRRLRFNTDLVEAARRCPGVRLEQACRVLRADLRPDQARVETDKGALLAGSVVAADGLNSSLARQLGWGRPPSPPHRFALVGHLDVPGHEQREIIVTLLSGREVYSAPAGAGTLLAAVLGRRGDLVPHGRSTAEAYRAAVEEAHPELQGAAIGAVRGAGPFRRRPSTVAQGRALLLGDAAGFLDPLTGEAMAAGVAAALELARLLDDDPESAAARYRAWHARQWRRRQVVTMLALLLTGGRRRATRAMKGVSRRPAALESLIEVNGGLRALGQVGLRDWAALAGF